ncbi:MAG: DUF3800 domain-containing protein [Terriglobales bacterium]
MAFVTAYLDESKSDSWFVLGGLVSTASSWKRFSREWEKVLQEYKVPYLHMKEFAFSRGPFEGWKESQRRSLLSRLLFLIKSPREPISSFSCDFEHLVFDEIFPPKFQAQQNHYVFALQSCISGITLHCERHTPLSQGEHVVLVFDQNAQFSPRALEAFNGYKTNPFLSENERGLVGSLSFADDKEVIPLQAADLLAYEINKNLRGYTRHPGVVLNELPGSHMIWDRKYLVEYASRMKERLPELFIA